MEDKFTVLRTEQYTTKENARTQEALEVVESAGTNPRSNEATGMIAVITNPTKHVRTNNKETISSLLNGIVARRMAARKSRIRATRKKEQEEKRAEDKALKEV